MDIYSVSNVSNHSNFSTPDMSSFCVQNGLSNSFKVFIICLYVIIFLVGFSGNILVIYAIKYKQKTAKTFDFYIISLAIADLLSSVFVPIVAIHDLVLDFSDWVLLGDFGCKIFVAIDHLTMLVSSFMLILISIERLRKIKSINLLNGTKTNYIYVIVEIMIVWILAISITAPYMASLHVKNNVCYTWMWSTYDNFLYHAFYVNLCSFVPLVLMVIIYTKSIYCLSRVENRSDRRRRNSHIKRITKMFACIVSVFFVLTVPYMIVHFITSYTGTYEIMTYCQNIQLYTSLTYAFYTLFNFNACVNPFIYAIMHPSVKRMFQTRGRVSTVHVTRSTAAVFGFMNKSRNKSYNVSTVVKKKQQHIVDVTTLKRISKSKPKNDYRRKSSVVQN